MTIETFPKTVAGRFEWLLDLYMPVVERKDGTLERDPAFGLISREDFMRLLESDA